MARRTSSWSTSRGNGHPARIFFAVKRVEAVRFREAHVGDSSQTTLGNESVWSHLRLPIEEVGHDAHLIGKRPPQVLGHVVHVDVPGGVPDRHELLLQLGIARPPRLQELHAVRNEAKPARAQRNPGKLNRKPYVARCYPSWRSRQVLGKTEPIWREDALYATFSTTRCRCLIMLPPVDFVRPQRQSQQCSTSCKWPISSPTHHLYDA